MGGGSPVEKSMGGERHGSVVVGEITATRHIQSSNKILRGLKRSEEWMDEKMGVETQGIDRIPEEAKQPPSIMNVSILIVTIQPKKKKTPLLKHCAIGCFSCFVVAQPLVSLPCQLSLITTPDLLALVVSQRSRWSRSTRCSRSRIRTLSWSINRSWCRWDCPWCSLHCLYGYTLTKTRHPSNCFLPLQFRFLGCKALLGSQCYCRWRIWRRQLCGRGTDSLCRFGL
jgi:hypothetical protein